MGVGTTDENHTSITKGITKNGQVHTTTTAGKSTITRGAGEHGGVGTPHARGASGEALGVGSDEASSISFCLRARWLVSSLTRRCGGLAARRLTCPLAEAPDTGVRPNARSDSQPPLAVGSHRACEADARIRHVGNALK